MLPYKNRASEINLWELISILQNQTLAIHDHAEMADNVLTKEMEDSHVDAEMVTLAELVKKVSCLEKRQNF